MTLAVEKLLAQGSRKTRRPVWDRDSWFSRPSSGLRNTLQQLTIKQVAAVAVTVGLAWYVWNEVSRPVVLIEPITVPSHYQELGFTSSVMSQRVLETIEIIERSAKTSQHKDQLGQSSDQDAVADFEVPGTKVSVRTLVNLFREFFHVEQMRIAGEITYIRPLKLLTTDPIAVEAQRPAQITFRLSEGKDHRENLTFVAPGNDPDTVIKKMAEAILRKLNPFVLAVYMSSSNNKLDIPKAIAIVRELRDAVTT